MKPTNTTSQAHSDPLATMLTTALPGGIEAQESAGQRELVNSQSLPTECHGREALESAGVKFGEPYPDDPIFCDASLPQGWSKRATNHAMYSELVDDKWRVRATIFYKAVFYDRSANMTVKRRYDATKYHDGSDDEHYLCVVMDSGTVIHVIAEMRRIDYAEIEEAGKEAYAWLDKHFPDWRSVAAYWGLKP